MRAWSILNSLSYVWRFLLLFATFFTFILHVNFQNVNVLIVCWQASSHFRLRASRDDIWWSIFRRYTYGMYCYFINDDLSNTCKRFPATCRSYKSWSKSSFHNIITFFKSHFIGPKNPKLYFRYHVKVKIPFFEVEA